MFRTRTCTPAVWTPPRTRLHSAKCAKRVSQLPSNPEKYASDSSQVTDYKGLRWWAV